MNKKIFSCFFFPLLLELMLCCVEFMKSFLKHSNNVLFDRYFSYPMPLTFCKQIVKVTICSCFFFLKSICSLQLRSIRTKLEEARSSFQASRSRFAIVYIAL